MTEFTSTLAAMKIARVKARQGQQPVSPIGAAAAVIVMLIAAPLSGYLRSPVPALLGLIVAILLAFSIKVARQWEKAGCCAWVSTSVCGVRASS